MGKIVISENVSLDGVVQDPTGEEGFRHGGWFLEVGDKDREEWLGSIPAHHLTNDRPHTVLIHSPLVRTARALQPPIERNTARAAEQGSSRGSHR
jgi:hypothetical protein